LLDGCRNTDIRKEELRTFCLGGVGGRCGDGEGVFEERCGRQKRCMREIDDGVEMKVCMVLKPT
jgi:hypothetical protein